MASLRDIRKHIEAIKNISQITSAMKMVAAARIRRAQEAILKARPFAKHVARLVGDLYGELLESDVEGTEANKYFEHREKGPKCLVIVTADKGLCGAFNASLLKTAISWIKANQDEKIFVIAVGKKGWDFIRRLKGVDLEIADQMLGIFPKAGFRHAKILGDHIKDLFLDTQMESVTVIYNEFKSMISQKVVTKQLLPLSGFIEKGIEKARSSGMEAKIIREDFIFEPDKEKLLSYLLPLHINLQLLRILMESQAAELAARMTAMEAASKNASELISGLTLKMNKTRQSMITTELNEIVSGAEALE